MPPRRYRNRRGRNWHQPERLAGQADRDAQLGRSQFYVYVLETSHGHYVGHTWNVRSRLRQHQRGEVPSTAGSSPALLWQSAPLQTREDAARFEASLKSLRDQRSTRFREITGAEPVPHRPVYGRPAGRGVPGSSRGGCFSFVTVALVLAALVALAAMLF